MFSREIPLGTLDPQILLLNNDLLQEYGLDKNWFSSSEGLSILAGKTTNNDNLPIAMAYAGHQFGHRTPLLGDGRAHMLGQMQTTNGKVDVQLKGSGPSIFSRRGDGRATLASVLREYILSEAMAGLGIPTTRSLAIIKTGEPVYREKPEPGGILVRTALSHLRVGSFQYAASDLGDAAVEALADHVIKQHFPELSDQELRYSELLAKVIEQQAILIAQWMLVGFIHGVMNTDNISVVSETIDFGPCAFMDEFNANKVFSSIDREGRYAWSNQPTVGLWNMTRFAETLLPILSKDSDTAIQIAETRLAKFMPTFQSSFYTRLRQKLGIKEHSKNANEFSDDTLNMLGKNSIDMTVFFDTLTKIAFGASEQTLFELFNEKDYAQQWLTKWQVLRAENSDTLKNMRLANPAIIARNHRVEEALLAASTQNDLAPLNRLVKALQNPFHCTPENTDLQKPPSLKERVKETFCGT